MIDINLYKEIFDKYTFDIHEAIEGKRLGVLKHLFNDINLKFPDINVKYLTSLGYNITCFINTPLHQKRHIEITIIKDGVCNTTVISYTFHEILKLLELEQKYY